MNSNNFSENLSHITIEVKNWLESSAAIQETEKLLTVASKKFSDFPDSVSGTLRNLTVGAALNKYWQDRLLEENRKREEESSQQERHFLVDFCARYQAAESLLLKISNEGKQTSLELLRSQVDALMITLQENVQCIARYPDGGSVCYSYLEKSLGLIRELCSSLDLQANKSFVSESEFSI